ncbi:MAG: glycine cleavage T C-terminal barrel domain-containing protein [Acidimicrobiia bacterium]
MSTIRIDGTALPVSDGDTVLVALARTGRFPPGALCGTGDCPNCLATIDGLPHQRMCRVGADGVTEVRTTPVDSHPPLADRDTTSDVTHRQRHVDVVVIGGGRSGTAEAERLRTGGRQVTVLEQDEGAEALAVYRGPEVLARVAGEIVRFHCQEVVVATGRAPILAVAPGSELAGILAPPAAQTLVEAAVDLGRVVTITEPVSRFEGSERVEAVVLTSGERLVADTVVVDLGSYPRDLLARMASDDRVRLVGGAAEEPDLPPCPDSGVVCPCSQVTVADLDFVWERGFDQIELIKRATLAGTGTCQGMACTPYLRSFVLARGGSIQPTFTARPLARQLTVGEAASGFRLPPVHRTQLDGVHRRLGARMDRIGGWFRPWTYPDLDAEYRAVREAVSVCDVSTLGKMVVRGPDTVGFLERLYPCRVADIRPGRSRYALLLAESGGLMDDGLISRVDDDTFHLTFTSGGASHAEAWLRDWAHGFDADVRIMDRTHSLGAINVTGPRATALLERVGLSEPMGFMRHGRAMVAGIPCHVYRLSFTGEVSYELHHPARHSVDLWEALMAAGTALGIHPHGLYTLQTLRLEKGHIIIGMDTEPDSTPRRLGMGWAVKMDKDDFVGKAALERTDALPVRKRLVGLTMAGDPPVDGTPLYDGAHLRGYVTSAAWSPILGRSVMLAWIDTEDGTVPDQVTVGGRTATLSDTPFYDPGGERARA